MSKFMCSATNTVDPLSGIHQSDKRLLYLAPVLDFRHVHLHKCMYFFLGASKIFYPTCTCACKFSSTCFTMLVDIHNTVIKNNIFSFHTSPVCLYLLVFSTSRQLRPSYRHTAYGRGMSNAGNDTPKPILKQMLSGLYQILCMYFIINIMCM